MVIVSNPKNPPGTEPLMGIMLSGVLELCAKQCSVITARLANYEILQIRVVVFTLSCLPIAAALSQSCLDERVGCGLARLLLGFHSLDKGPCRHT